MIRSWRAFWAGQLGPVESIEAVDDSTVKFTLSTPYTPFLAALANVNASIMPMQELADGSFDPDSEMLGTGPYMVTEHNQDESWVFERNPHYWRAGYPKLDRVEVKIITDDTARVAALRDGSIDIALFENVDAPLVLEGVENVETVIQDTTDYWRIDVNEIWDQAKLTNDDVRFAVNMAIDREQIRDVALGGLGTPTAATPPGFAESCDPSAVPSAARDLDRARQILAENGAEDLSFTLIASPYLPQIPLIAQVIQQNLAEIGVDVEIAQLEVGDWQTRVFSDNPGTFDAAMSWFAGYADPAMVVSWWNPETALWNQGFLEPDAGDHRPDRPGPDAAGREPGADRGPGAGVRRDRPRRRHHPARHPHRRRRLPQRSDQPGDPADRGLHRSVQVHLRVRRGRQLTP